MSLRERLENNNLPLGMLTNEEVQELIISRFDLLRFGACGGWFSILGYIPENGINVEGFKDWFGHNCIIRIKRRPVVKPSIDWSHVSSEYDKLAVDQDGRGLLYTTEAELECNGLGIWIVKSGPIAAYIRADCFASYLPGNCDWKDSLVTRPQEVD